MSQDRSDSPTGPTAAERAEAEEVLGRTSSTPAKLLTGIFLGTMVLAVGVVIGLAGAFGDVSTGARVMSAVLALLFVLGGGALIRPGYRWNVQAVHDRRAAKAVLKGQPRSSAGTPGRSGQVLLVVVAVLVVGANVVRLLSDLG